MSKFKQFPIVFFIPFFVGLIGFFFAFSHFKNLGSVAGISTTIDETTSAITPSEPTVLLVKEVGEISYKLPNTDQFLNLNQNQINIPTGTVVKTGSNAFAHVVFSDNSLMSLSKETEVVINFEDKKIKIFQLLGNTWHRVQKVLEGHSYEVETPGTLATVRGTEFNVEVLANNESLVYVVESIVEVAKIAQENGQVVTKETQLVEKDKHISVSAPTSVEPSKLITMPEEKKNTDWFKRNEKLTEEIEKAEIKAVQKIQVQESQVSPEAPTHSATTTPVEVESLIDFIKEKVIKEVMDSIQENTEMKKIDDEFGIVRPEPEKVSGNESKQDEHAATEHKESEDIGGVARTIENDPSPLVEPTIESATETSFFEPSDLSESERTPTHSASSSEESQEATPELTKEAQDNSENQELVTEQESNAAPDQSAASTIFEMIDNLFD